MSIRSVALGVVGSVCLTVTVAAQDAPAPPENESLVLDQAPTSRAEPEALEMPDGSVPDYAVEESEMDLSDIPVFRVDEMGDEWEPMDTTDDGVNNYAVIVNSENELIRAVMDYSGDGYFDNFYYYDSGELYLHELDTNSDQQIDVRVFLENGASVRGFEQDTNHDGSMDLEEIYGE